MRAKDQTLLIRALNSTKQSYFPTYVALRLIGKNLATGTPDYLQNLIDRRINAGETWRYKNFKLYKGTNSSSGTPVHEYRDCLAPNPSTALAGAAVLGELSKNPAFACSQQVYSYRWPATQNSGSSYRFFAEGYKERNGAIFNALHKGERIAVVTDIKRFYPSVQVDQIRANLNALFCTTPNSEKIEGISDFFM